MRTKLLFIFIFLRAYYELEKIFLFVESEEFKRSSLGKKYFRNDIKRK